MSQQDLEIRIMVKGRRDYIAPSRILWIYADKNYSQLQLDNGSTHLIAYAIGTVAKQVGDGFIRIHRQYLCNRTHIAQIDLTKYLVRLRSGHTLPVSRRRLRILRTELTQHIPKSE